MRIRVRRVLLLRALSQSMIQRFEVHRLGSEATASPLQRAQLPSLLVQAPMDELPSRALPKDLRPLRVL